MQQEDERAVEEGVIKKEEALRFHYREERGKLVEMVIDNYRTEERLARIKEALHWALNRDQQYVGRAARKTNK